ncbi:dUTP diphosphatase [Clostridium felsineum]|uniref:Uncharacterized protein n=1 Tax=Clostridium felsineum TaxID=36839 RepID=A0A1S8L5X5_9CLOT|nr:dUTP diphosphatase [Clostridium felsineum]MCR3757441.1 dUTP diphosphatase [Clostridium felsineum]URZ03027.1 hypothetical protein CLAUR_030730 [Clostridium felsineum]URZ08643.1 hypothetical protein CLROS_040250 [Clostridium felsineum]URZ13673.1 hypothetical protein CROST_044390 [Clostridium felsineum]URZ14368.1 hypothetical protein CLFE_003650 [Clostridium felsineum DSM 794]
MNLNKLFHLQKNLDKTLINQRNLSNENLYSQKTLALQVQFGELAGKTRCFNYWNNEVQCERNAILKEYINCLHFILSIGLDKEYIEFNLPDSSFSPNMVDQFLGLFIDINDFVICSSKDNYITLFQDFINLGKNLGFDDSEIENEYIEKTELIRQM